MRLVICVILVIATCDLTLAKKRDLWWLFPKRNQNGGLITSANSNSSQQVTELLNNRTEELLASSVRNADYAQSDIGDDNDSTEVEGNDEGSAIGKADIEIVNKTIKDHEEDLNWTKDDESDEEPNQDEDNHSASNEEHEKLTTVTIPLEEDNQSPDKLEVKGIATDDDDNQLSKERLEIDDDQREFSGDEEEIDQAIHIDGDVHPSSKLQLEKELLNSNQDDQDIGTSGNDWDDQGEENAEGDDTRRHDSDDQGKAEAEVLESLEREDEASSDELLARTLIDGQVNAEATDEPKNIENDDEFNSPVGSAEDQKQDASLAEEDEKSNGMDNSGEDDSEDDNEVQPTPPQHQESDLIPNTEGNLHWVDEETVKLPNEIIQDLPVHESEKENVEKLPNVAVSPKFETPACDFDQTPFTLKLLPAVSSQVEGIDIELICEYVPLNESVPIPSFTLTWTYEKLNCSTNGQKMESCTKVLASMNYESPILSRALSYNLQKLNQTSHAGNYICDAEIYGCQTQNTSATKSSARVYVRVYAKPNYMLHIGIVSAACVLLLILLGVMVAFTRKIQKRSKSRYQELLSTTNIEYLPTKVLELPNSVYNPTTTRFVRMSASTYSSKSSFTSNEEEA